MMKGKDVLLFVTGLKRILRRFKWRVNTRIQGNVLCLILYSYAFAARSYGILNNKDS